VPRPSRRPGRSAILALPRLDARVADRSTSNPTYRKWDIA
jgi:hypothetical protein